MNSINKIEQHKTKEVTLPISLAERRGLEIKELYQKTRKNDEVNYQYINKQLGERKQKNDLEKSDNHKCQLKSSKPQTQKLTMQFKLT